MDIMRLNMVVRQYPGLRSIAVAVALLAAFVPVSGCVLFGDGSGPDTLTMCDLATGEITPLMSIGSPGVMQISGRAFGTPGWAIVATGDRVLAVELKQDGRVFGLAWPNSPGSPRATVDRNFTRVLFASSWGRSDTGAFDTYMIVLPQGWTDRL